MNALPFGPYAFNTLKPCNIFVAPAYLADHLLQKRKKNGLIQREVAEAMNVALHNYIEWERGTCHPRMQDWPKVIKHLGYDPIKQDGSFGSRVEALRRRMGIYHRDLATYLGINRDTLRRWMRNDLEESSYRCQKARDVLTELLQGH